MVSCWNDKRNATIDQIENDRVYPYDHFTCKLKIFKEAIGKTNCACQTEKGFKCDISPGVGLG
ncbi:unnamed protein product [Larinioides sclopetarius]|uniref:Uncharacterized protein n=1 Tax=Larinioides sclopetarius TaxID=280406 RepID=A0AAV2B7T6_9ARAC